MTTLRFDIEYDGTDFHGWQIQPDARTVQGEIADALSTVLRRRVVPVGAGRTDAGVHALGQVASCVVEEPVDEGRLLRSLNGLTGDDVVVHRVRAVEDAFHARRSAVERRYRYRFLDAPSATFGRVAWKPRPLDWARVEEALPFFLGEHDFTSFAASEDASPSKRCRVRVARLARWEAGVELTVAADRFLHRMVRSIVGTLVEVGSGRRDPVSIPRIIEARRRSDAGATAPAKGLCLLRVEYEPPPGE